MELAVAVDARTPDAATDWETALVPLVALEWASLGDTEQFIGTGVPATQFKLVRSPSWLVKFMATRGGVAVRVAVLSVLLSGSMTGSRPRVRFLGDSR